MVSLLLRLTLLQTDIIRKSKNVDDFKAAQDATEMQAKLTFEIKVLETRKLKTEKREAARVKALKKSAGYRAKKNKNAIATQ